MQSQIIKVRAAKLIILLFLVTGIRTSAQPVTPSELAWPPEMMGNNGVLGGNTGGGGGGGGGGRGGGGGGSAR